MSTSDESLVKPHRKPPHRSSSSKNSVATRRPAPLRALLSACVLLGGTFAFVATQIIAAVLFGLSFSIVGLNDTQIEELSSNNIILLGMYTVSSLLLISILYGVCKLFRRPFLQLVGLARKPIVTDLIWAMLTYSLYFVGFTIVLTAFLPVFQEVIDVDQQQNFGVDLQMTAMNTAILFVMFVVIAPLIEEVLFRGFMYRSVRNWMPKWLATIIISILFGAMHLELLSGNSPNWIAMIDTAVLSVALIVVVEKTNSLWPAIYVHALKNLVAFTLLVSGVNFT